MAEVISERKLEEAKADQKLRLIEAQLATQYTVMGMSVAAQSDKQVKWLQGFVKKMNFLRLLDPDKPEREEEKDLPATSQVMAAFGGGPDGFVGKRSD